jgi:ferric-dicitrate binding protein FerR (iron transport regulator)
MQSKLITAALVAILASAPGIVRADDWLVTKLRGGAVVLTDGKWQPLRRGDVVSDDSAIQTLDRGRISLQRGKEIIDLEPRTAIRIQDRDGRQFTTVQQYFGTVSAEVEVKDVKHFAIVNDHLAAVVKGTRFTVQSDDDGAEVSVQRGRVSVKDGDTYQTVEVTVGETVSTSGKGEPMRVGWTNDLPANASATAEEKRGHGRNRSEGPGNSSGNNASGGSSNSGGEGHGNSGGNGNAGGNSNAGGKGNGPN